MENTRPQDIRVELPLDSVMDRISLEQHLREKLKTVHQKRLYCVKMGLPTKVAFDMKPITVTHWILDKEISDGRATGQLIGASSELGADDNKDNFDQFTQRLAMFIENGWAMTPNKGEGIDMNRLAQPPQPPAPPNGAPGVATPPAPPPMPGVAAPPVAPAVPAPQPGVPAGVAPQMPAPPAPPAAAPQVPPPVAAPPVPGAPVGAPPMPQTAPPMAPAPAAPAPQMAAPQPQQPMAPAAPQPVTPAPAAPQQAGNLPTVLIKEDPNRAWGRPSGERKRRTKAEIKEDTAWTDAGKPGNVQTITLAQAQAAKYQVDADMRIVGGPATAAPPMQAQAPAAPAPAAPPAAAAPAQGNPMIVPPNPLTGANTMQAAAPAAPVPTSTAQAPTAPQTQGITMPGSPAVAPLPTMPPMGGVPAPAPSVDLSEVTDQLKLIDAGLALLLRASYQKQGELTLVSILTELNALPQ